MIKDWEVINTDPWVLQPTNGAMVRGDDCAITYAQTKTWEHVIRQVKRDTDGKPLEPREREEITETEDRIETYSVVHTRGEFPVGILVRGVQSVLQPQTDNEWHANIRREIMVDLSDLNKDDNLPAETDITSRVR